MKRVASIDIGTNSVLLLVAEERGGSLVPLLERATITRLGQGVDRTRQLAPEAIERTLACLERYAEDLREHAPEALFVVGTSAMRDAEGGASFRERARALLGVEPRVASGDEEAELTFLGSLSGLRAHGDVLVFDVGGGSTEIIVGGSSAGPREKISLDIGSVRLTERHVRSDPPSAAELQSVREDVRAALAKVPFSPSGHVVGVAGTVTTLAAFVKGIAPYDAARVHGAELLASEVSRAAADLAGLTLDQRRALAAIDPKRADVIVAGAVLVDELLRFCGADTMTVSDRGVRWGLVARALAAAPTAGTP
jgi:exopolyphosphatase/guanosine-5'-triphosphate,3'-diphosphate pyrophosphatase